MIDHTTHFDDCGCKSGRLEKETTALKSKVKELEEDNARLRGKVLPIEHFFYVEKGELKSRPMKREEWVKAREKSAFKIDKLESKLKQAEKRAEV